MSRWYSAQVQPGQLKNVLYPNVKKLSDGRVVVFQRHFVTVMTQDEARKKLHSPVLIPEDQQAEIERDYQWYLNH